MDLDLVTNGSKIKDNVNLLNNGKISWIVLGYTNNKTIKVVETGSDSFEDMFEEFDSNKIMYGFAAVTDPNTKLKKNVFIYWQGSAATQSMKTTSVSHSNIIRDLCKPVHVTHNARDEQDLDLKEIMTKVASASGANYSCHNESQQVFQKESSVKSEGNTAVNVRQTRMQELSALGSLTKAPDPDQRRSSSNYEKVDAITEIKNFRKQSIDKGPVPKTVGSTYSKIDAAKEIKASSILPNREPDPHHSVGTNYTKVDASKEIKSSMTTSQAPKNVSPVYKTINPEKEFKSIPVNQKSLFENRPKVESENNTAQNAKEERQKEMLRLFSKTSSIEDDGDRKVASTYKKVNPMAEIQKLRSESVSKEEEDVVFHPSNNYKKIDATADINDLRRSSLYDANAPVSPGTNYKKINPAEEIKKLKSQASVEDKPATIQSYKKINPMEEIKIARKASIGSEIHTSQPSNFKDATESNVVQPAAMSARKSFEHAHKVNYDTHQPHKNRLAKDDSIQEHENPRAQQNFNFESNTHKVDNSRTPQTILPTTSPVVEPVRAAVVISSVKDEIKNTAEAQFDYDAIDIDEISFAEGEIIRDIEYIDDHWWSGKNAAGKKGMFPASYVMTTNIEQTKKEHHRVDIPDPEVVYNDPSHSDKNPRDSSNDKSQLASNDSVSAVAVYDYQGNDDDEISFDVGEIIKGIEQIDDGWWIGINRAGQKGMFPSNFVKLESSKQDVPTMSAGSIINSVVVRALFDYCAQDDDEVSFNTGEKLYNVTVVDDGWWEGELVGGKRGLFPSNFVETV